MTLSTRLDLDRRRRDVRWLQKNGRVVHHGGRVNQLDRGLVRGLIAVHRWLRKNGRVVHHSGCITSWNRGLDRGPDRGLIAVQL
jgi:predicted methyltransferase